MTEPLILASASPRRRELLERVGAVIEVVPADIDESALSGETATEHAARLAAQKCAAIAHHHPDRVVLAADTVVEIERSILGKPTDREDAKDMLEQLSGAVHRVTTAVSVRAGDQQRALSVTAEAEFRALTPDDIAGYLASGEWRGKAGGYAVQGIGAALVSSVRGSITTVVGLPIAEVVVVLRELCPGAVDFARGQAC